MATITSSTETFYNPTSVTIGTTDITTVTSISMNIGQATGAFSGDNDAVSSQWVGVKTIGGTITLGDIAQAYQLVGQTGTLSFTLKGTGAASDRTISITNCQLTGPSVSQPHNGNSNGTITWIRTHGGTTCTISYS